MTPIFCSYPFRSGCRACLILALLALAAPSIGLAQEPPVEPEPPPAGTGEAPVQAPEPEPALPIEPDLPPSAAEPAPGSSGSAPAPEPHEASKVSKASEGREGSEPSGYGAVGVAPGPHGKQALDKVPNNVLRLDGAALRSQHAIGLNEALNQQLGSVVINDVQNNPLQPDLQFRGFTASPLLGTPQGISLYQNGVRLNEPFGEVVQWDLIPMFALYDVEIMPGENAVYGLNTLGGSMVMRMKNGWNSPGGRLEASAGSFARYRATAEYGHSEEDWSAYAGGSLFGEQGFREKSDSSAQNFYSDVRKRGLGYEVGASLTLAHSNLRGNGPLPIELLRRSRAAVYTWPDITKNDLVMLNIDGQKRLTRAVNLQGVLYLRHTTRATLNGDNAELDPCTTMAGVAAICQAGEVLTSSTGMTVESDSRWNAVYNNTNTSSAGVGGSLQLEARSKLAEHNNQFLVGASYDGSQVKFGQTTELGQLTIDRGVIGGGPQLAGAGRETELFSMTHMIGIYALDTFDITESLSVQVSARANLYSLQMDDRLGNALDGDHFYGRVNPALGLTHKLSKSITLFAAYGEANRAPSAAELACADPDEPCRLPNAFISDPPLEQVVSRSAELGMRFRAGPEARPIFSGSLAAFGARNSDDILFVAGERVGTGYFRNAGLTQRLGAEASIRGDFGRVQLYASYTLLRATFESDLRLPRNTADDDDDDADGGDDNGQRVEKGSRIPGLPMHSVKAGVTVHITPELALGVSVIGQSSQPFRGDESNQSPFVRGYYLVNAQASYRLLPPVTLFLRAQNLLNRKYETFGVLAQPEVIQGAMDPRFLGVGAPVGVWAGIVIEDPT